MNVLLLGNGFDLHHKLPTKYINFLNTANFLSKVKFEDIKTIGDVFGNSELQKIDKVIAESFIAYQQQYNQTSVCNEKLKDIVTLTKNNVWFDYLLNSFNADLGWIDFEKEISFVINFFQHILSEERSSIPLANYNKTYEYLLNCFNFFIDNETKPVYTIGLKHIKKDYLIEYPLGSKHCIANKEKIVSKLFIELKRLIEALKLYLKYFVDSILENIKSEESIFWSEAFSYVNDVITFNYTNTFSKLYTQEASVYHLHGNVDNNIVLGVNPDSFDEISNIDTSFIAFKKYFQRVKLKTDVDYIRFIKDLKEMKIEIALYVIGHSLDVTDRDIIEELFNISNEINVLSYNDIDEHQHITNIINIFGKEKFDELRSEKNLTFLPITTDLTQTMINNHDSFEAVQVIYC